MKQRSCSAYSMIEPPSVSESSTACLAMVDSTSSTSRLELTASPTSRSASSSSTFVASSAPRASSSWTSLTLLIAIAACAANAETMAISRSSNGLDLVRHTFRAPTTSSSRSIGAPMIVRKPATR